MTLLAVSSLFGKDILLAAGASARTVCHFHVEGFGAQGRLAAAVASMQCVGPLAPLRVSGWPSLAAHARSGSWKGDEGFMPLLRRVAAGAAE